MMLSYWRTHTLVIAARNAARATGLTRPLARLLNGPGYEARYDAALRSQIRPGDVVWDVGANVGVYTQIFADAVGAHGRVIAFEPSVLNFEQLRLAAGTRHNCTLRNFGLGAQNETLRFKQGPDRLGATSRIRDSEEGDEKIAIRSAASLLAEGEPSPNVVKIDVEGHEFEVLQGFHNLLNHQSLRTIGLEVHFGLLAESGRKHVPRAIEALLTRSGFHLRWTDSSHLLATRP